MAAVMLVPPVAARAPVALAPDLNPVAERVEAWVAEGVYPGASIIVGRGDRVLLERHFGSYCADTQVQIASAGKWLAAATIAALVDEGKLRWDDPAAKWIPGLTGPMGRATLRQLMSHTAGYPDYQPADRPRDHYATLEEAVANIVSLPADADPGTRFRYGGLAMQVAGRMAERATGQAWDTLFQTRIAQPLGLRATGFTPVPDEPGFSPMLGGSAHTTLGDYARFLRMIAGGGIAGRRRVLSSAALAEMERDQVGAAVLLPGEYVDQARAARFTGVYGIGQWREEVDVNGRATLLSSPGWAGAYPWIDRRTGTWGFVLAKVDKERAMARGFSSFLAGSVLPMMVRDALADRARGWQHGHVPVPGGRLFWEAVGKGPAMILLHDHSLDRTMWDPQMAELSKRFRVVRYDLRGYGRSISPSEAVNRLHVDDLRLLMDHLGIAKAHVVGLSLGGAVALDMLAVHPDRLFSVTAASLDRFGYRPASDEPRTPPAIALRRGEIAALTVGGVQQYQRRWLDELTTRGGGCVDVIRPRLWERIQKWNAWQPLRVETRLLGRALLDRLRARPSRLPVQILTGDADLWRGDAFPAAFAAVPRVVVPNSGHMSNMENPAGFNEAVLRLGTTGRTGRIGAVTPCSAVA